MLLFLLDAHFTKMNFYIQAKAINYENDWRYTSDEMYIRTYTPDAYRHLTKWYSASETYMYIPSVVEKQKCESEKELDVYFNAEDGKPYTLFAIVSTVHRILLTIN